MPEYVLEEFSHLHFPKKYKKEKGSLANIANKSAPRGEMGKRTRSCVRGCGWLELEALFV